MTTKKALSTGITGQHSSHLAELLLANRYEDHALIRLSNAFSTGLDRPPLPGPRTRPTSASSSITPPCRIRRRWPPGSTIQSSPWTFQIFSRGWHHDFFAALDRADRRARAHPQLEKAVDLLPLPATAHTPARTS